MVQERRLLLEVAPHEGGLGEDCYGEGAKGYSREEDDGVGKRAKE